MRVATGKDDPALHETTWPLPERDDPDRESLQHKLRYGEPTRSDLLCAAEVLAAYSALIDCGTTAQQTRRLAALRRVHRRKP